LEVEKEQLDVEQERERMVWGIMQFVCNLYMSQEYVAQILGGIFWGSDLLWVDLGGIEGDGLENKMVGMSEKRLEIGWQICWRVVDRGWIWSNFQKCKS